MQRVALAMALVLAFASAAFASELPTLYDGELSASFKAVDGEAFTFGGPNATLNLKHDLGEEGAWTLYAEFGNLLDNGPQLGADKYRLEMRDPLFTLNFWGNGYELSERKSPFDFIVVSKDPSRGARLESGPVWVDIREEDVSTTYVFLEESFGDITVGAAARVNNQGVPIADPDKDGIATNTRALGYVKGSFGPASVTGAFGKHLGYNASNGEDLDNESAQTVLGVLASVDLGVLVPEVEYLSRDAAGWDNQGTKIRAKATHNNDAFGSVYGQFITESNVDAEPLATEIEGGANLNGIGSVKARMRNEVDPETEDPTRSLLEVTGEDFLDGSVFAKFSNDTDEQAEVTTMTVEGIYRSSTARDFDKLTDDDWHQNDAYFGRALFQTVQDGVTTIEVTAGSAIGSSPLKFIAEFVTQSLEGGNLDFDAWGLHGDVKVGEGANSDSAMKARVRARYALDGNTDLNPTVGFGSGNVNGEASSLFFGKLDIERRYSAATAKFGVGFGSESIGGADAETKSLISGSLEIPF